MKQAWELSKSEFLRVVNTESPSSERLRQEIAVRYGVVDYDYIVQDAVSRGIKVDPEIRRTASIKSPRLVQIQAYSVRAVRSIKSFSHSISRFLFE